MASPLAGSLSASIYKGMKSLFLDATLTRDVAAGGDTFDPQPPTTQTYSCKAVRDNYGVGYRSGGLVGEQDVKIIILQGSLSVTPQAGDRITIDGQGGPWSLVSDGGSQPAVMADPAAATWECRGRA